MQKYLTRETPGILFRHSSVNEATDDTVEYYHETNPEIGGGKFKLDVGNECNLLLDLAEQMEADDMAGHTTEAIRSIVSRVAEFEELETEPCEACKGKGWLNCNTGNDDHPKMEIQRCDACEKYASDAEARTAHGREAKQ